MEEKNRIFDSSPTFVEIGGKDQVFDSSPTFVEKNDNIRDREVAR